jgi:sporulation protein YlmC with PRC-barrel domain
MTLHRSAFALAVTVLLATVAFAADKQRDSRKDDAGETRGVLVHKGSDNRLVTHVFRGSDLIGMAVRNSDGKDLGTVDDYVADFECGNVRYAAIGFGGFLGFGEKLFAVPLGVMGVNYDGEKQKSFLVFDTTADELKNSPGFDRNKWPDMADPKWSHEIDKFYGVSFNDTTVEVAIEKDNSKSAAKNEKEHRNHHIIRGSYLRSMNVRNNDGDDLGTMKDVVIDLQSGELTHLIASRSAGTSREYVAIPVHAAAMKENLADNKPCIFMSVSKDRFNGAPHFSDKWPNFNGEKWSQEFDTYFRAQTAARASR